MVQEHGDAGFNLCFGAIGIGDSAVVRVLLVVCLCLAMPLKCEAELPTPPEREHLQEQIGVDRVEFSALQQNGAHSLGDGIPFVSSIIREREPMTKDRADQNAKNTADRDRPRATEQINNELQWLYAPLAFVFCFLLGFAITYR